jgi:hypothetical protein
VRRVFVVFIALGLLLLLPQAAHSVDDVSIEVLSAPPQNSVLRGDESFPITFRAQADSTLRFFAISILIGEEPVPGMRVNGGYSSGSWGAGETGEATLHVDWDTRSVTPYNGLYRVGATAESHLDGVRDTSLEGYIVDNLPAQVSDVDAELDGGAPSLSWPPNSEPDLIGYNIYRSTGSGDYTKVGSVTTRSFTDKDVPKDTELKYYVVATRRSVASEDGAIESPPSMARTFVIPSPGSGQQPTISAPQEAPAAPPVPKVVPRPAAKITHEGFEETLPYTEPIAGDQVLNPLGQEQATSDNTTFEQPPALRNSQVYKPPFLAAALLLLAAAAHMIRLAITLFSGGSAGRAKGSPLTTPASSS